MPLHGKTALITGAAQRIGRAIAEQLAADGCDTAIHYHTSAAMAEETSRHCAAKGVRSATFRADLGDPQQVAGLVSAVVNRFGRLDFLVHNAAQYAPMSLESFDLTAWNRTMQINLTAAMQLAHAAADELRKRSGRIVNLSDAAVARARPDQLAYFASKAGLEALTRGLARSLAPQVTVNAVAPGIAAWPDAVDMAQRDRLTKRIPLRRAGTPDDVAAAVHFLLTAGGFITGAILPVDGGRQVAG